MVTFLICVNLFLHLALQTLFWQCSFLLLAACFGGFSPFILLFIFITRLCFWAVFVLSPQVLSFLLLLCTYPLLFFFQQKICCVITGILYDTIFSSLSDCIPIIVVCPITSLRLLDLLGVSNCRWWCSWSCYTYLLYYFGGRGKNHLRRGTVYVKTEKLPCILLPEC